MRSTAFAVGAVLLSACTTGDDPAAVESGPTVTATTTTTTTPVGDAPDADGTPDAADQPADVERLCATGATQVVGRVGNPALDEASGLVASRRHDDVFWSHNDGNESPGLFALAANGDDLGFHPLELAGIVDVEDLALVAGTVGDDLLLADVGDNRRARSTIRLYRVPEPDPSAPGPISDVEVLEFVYPDGAHDAETLLVDDDARSVVIVTKEQHDAAPVPSDFAPTAPSLVFEGPLDGHDGTPVELSLVTTIDTPALETRTVAPVPHPASLIGIGGLPTAGDVSADGRLVAVRTYETAWLWTREEGGRLVDAFAGTPCQVRVAAEPQGEAIAFDGDRLVTIGEGVEPPVNRVGP